MILKNYRVIFIVGLILMLFSFAIDELSPGKYSKRGVARVLQQDIINKENDFKDFCSGNDISQIQSNISNEKVNNKFLKKPYFIFLYEPNNPIPILWNTQSISPDDNIIFSTGNNYVAHLGNGYYDVIKRSIFIKNKKFIAFALIPIKYEYYINNNYLHDYFSAISGIDDRFYISGQKTDQVIKSSNGNTLYYLGIKKINANSFNNTVTIFLRLLAMLIFFFLLQQFCRKLVNDKGLLIGALSLFFSLLVLRALSYFFPFPFNFKQFELFSPLIYASSQFLPSLGDLFINVFLVEWLILFVKDDLLRLKISWPVSKSNKIGYTILVCIAMMGITILSGFILKSLVSDSQISFAVLNFFSLNAYTVIGFIILCGIASIYFFIMQLLVHVLKPIINENVYIPGFVIVVLSLLLLSLFVGKNLFVFYFALFAWMLLFLALLNFKNLSTFRTKIISGKIIFWIFFFSISITVVIISENNRKELDSRKHYLENLADKNDPSGERMMSITLSDLKSDYLPLIFNRFKNKSDNYFLKDSLLHENFPGYLNHYEIRIYTFDSTGEALYNSDATNLNALNVIYETQSHPTSVPDLSYYDVSFEQFNYITRKTVKSIDGTLKGFLFIISSPKKYKSDELYPQLFNKGNGDAIENSPLYSYAIYNNRYLVNNYNDYPFPTSLPKSINFYSNFYERDINGYSELWLKVNGNKFVVIAKPNNVNIESLTLFAYLFCFFLAGITLVNLVFLLVRSEFDLSEVRRNIQLTIRNQVHGTIILISLISFIIIGIATILFFINRYNKNDHEKLSRTINIIEKDIINLSDSTFTFLNSDSNHLLNANDRLASAVTRIAEIHGSDINIYDLAGNLKVSSLPLPYNKGILSKLMDPLAYFHLNKLKDAQYFANQKVGDLQYLNNYIPLRNKSGNELGYLNIPFFESQNKLYEEISNFLVTIINLNAFIFLIAGIIAFFITNRITESFFFIRDRMKEVNIGKTNELIKWTRKDEIGELVKEYNRMVMKLEESAENLAKNEREGAWREMARQVAHEIKNPLTPMKLNLQYLQMAIDNKSPNVIDISLYVTKILVEQIDHLSQIASDFSQFADINHSHNLKFDVNEILNKLYLLYAANSNLKIDLQLNEEASFIFADKTQVQRLFTNLIQNAVQAIPEGRQAYIQINSEIIGDKILTSIKDNGGGIPISMREKIFTPNFTTKSSGTGLGLAMCKGIVEKIGGEIWFETIEDSGTTFFVEIPLEKG